MPFRIAAIASTLAECVDGGTHLMDRLEREFHTLAGTAGTYDLNSVAAAAFEGEKACTELTHLPLNTESIASLAFLVDQLYDALTADVPAQRDARAIMTSTDARRSIGVSAA